MVFSSSERRTRKHPNIAIRTRRSVVPRRIVPARRLLAGLLFSLVVPALGIMGIWQPRELAAADAPGNRAATTTADSVPSAQTAEDEDFPIPPMTSPPDDLPPLEYVEVGDRIPNYLPRAKWGTQGKPYSRMQKPLSPEASQKRFVTPEGFHVSLFADERHFAAKPIAMNWDHRGRLWICETRDYPNDLQPPGQGHDQIRVCEDTDHDGRAERFTVFATGLSIPTALTFYRDGVIVQNGTETWYLKDTDGDGRADLKKVLIRGWNMSDTHGGVSHFRYGHDNWYWAMQGYNDSHPTVDGVERASFRMGFWRFRLDGNDPPSVTQIEFMRSTNNNTWGLGFNEEGEVFGSTANHNPSVFLGIPNRYYENVRGWSPTPLGGIAESHLFRPITEHVRQVDHHGGYTAAAGHAIYTARAYPAAWWNRTAFVCGPTGHLVGTFVLRRQGAGYRSAYRFNLAASTDQWTAPIAAEIGPDGFVWLIDWYNYIVQHNPTPKGFETGKGNAYRSELRDKRRGRIYRVVYDAAPAQATAWQPLDRNRPELLIAALAHPTLRWRLHAQRLLVERGRDDVVPQLLKLVNRTTTDRTGLQAAAIHALWTLDGLHAVEVSAPQVWKTVVAALRHPSAGVRMTAVRVFPRNEIGRRALLESERLHDADARVRKEALLALSEMGPAHSASGRVLAELLFAPETLDDRWLREALTCAAATHALPTLRAISRLAPANRDVSQPQGSSTTSHSESEEAERTADTDHAANTNRTAHANRGANTERAAALIAQVAQHWARGRPAVAEVAQAAEAMVAAAPEWGKAMLRGIVDGWPADYQIELPEAAEARLATWVDKLDSTHQSMAIRLGNAWQLDRLDTLRRRLVQRMLKTVLDEAQSPQQRVDAARHVVQLSPRQPDVVEGILAAITPETPPQVAQSLVQTLEASRAETLAEQLTQHWAAWPPALRQAAVGVMLARKQTTEDLLNLLSDGRIGPADLTLTARRRLLAHPVASIQQRAKKLLGRDAAPDPNRAAVIERLMPVTKRQGNAAEGHKVFRKQCATCHRFQGEGETIGPDLTGMAVHPKAELLTHIIDPNRSVEGNFHVYTLVLNDGRVLNGMLGQESRTTVELIDAQARRQVVQRSDIEEIVASRKSLMPEGFEQQLSPQQLADLLQFLVTPSRYVPLSLHRVATAASSGPLFHSSPGGPDRLVWDRWGTVSFHDIPFLLSDPRGGRAPNIILLHGPRGTLPPTMPRSITIDCHTPLTAVHLLGGISGWGFPAHPEKSISLIVRFRYSDGSTEDHPLRNGYHLADYIRRVDVPGSEYAFDLGGRQLRYLAVHPRKADPIESITFIKGHDPTAPIIMAVTLEPRRP